MSKRTVMQQRYGSHMTVARIRDVWAAVSQSPNATVRELADAVGMPYVIVSASLRLLRDAGYIQFEPRAERARTIVIPFITTKGAPR